MKRILWIILLNLGLVFLMPGCSTDGQDDLEELDDQEDQQDQEDDQDDQDQEEEQYEDEDEEEGGNDLSSLMTEPQEPAEDIAPSNVTQPVQQDAPVAGIPKTLPSTTKAQAGSWIVKSYALAIRTQPNLNAKLVGYLKENQSVNVVKQGWNGWSQIGPSRFVRSKYLWSAQKGTVGSGNTTYAVKSRALYIRSTPGGEIVGVLKKGEMVKANKANGGWSKLGPGKYVRTRYLKYLSH